MGTEIARLHLITPAAGPEQVLAAVGQVLAGGAPLVQVRVKGGTDRSAWRLAAAVARRCHDAGARCVVNDRADIAVAAGAHGVHIGEDDLPVAPVRRIVGPHAVVGVTCRDFEAARRAEAEGATYLGVGPAFTTSTKPGLPPALGLAGVARVASAVGVPVIAVGGVTASRLVPLLDAGAYGVAVCGAAFSAADPRAATEELRAALEDAVGSRR